MILAFITSVKQRMRLLQESWLGSKGTQRLAQLLSTILDPDISFETNAPLIMNPQSDGNGGVQPPMVVNNWTAGNTLVNINDTNGQNYGSIVLDDNGLTFYQPNGPNGSLQPVFGGSGSSGGSSSGSSGNVFPATIASGTGSTYTVSVYRDGRSGIASTETATHPQIDDDETIPAGTKCQVVQTGSTYEIMGVATWLE